MLLSIEQALGIEVRFSQWATVEKQVEEPRTWRQRLFSWPWKPWVKIEAVMVHEPAIFFINRPDMGLYFLVHPSLKRRLEEATTLTDHMIGISHAPL